MAANVVLVVHDNESRGSNRVPLLPFLYSVNDDFQFFNGLNSVFATGLALLDQSLVVENVSFIHFQSVANTLSRQVEQDQCVPARCCLL